MKKGTTSFIEKVREMMQRSGLSYHACCARLGSRGGKAAAAKRRRIAFEQKKQAAMKIV